MGKYMKKSKITGGVAVMDASQSATLAMGVRTRAKTLALQRLQSQSQTQSPPRASNPDKDTSSASLCYLQLRSRRLEKPQQPPVNEGAKRKENVDSATSDKLSFNSNSNSNGGSSLRVSSAKAVDHCERQGRFGKKCQDLGSKFVVQDLGTEASFGENCVDFEPWERSTRESTPCSLIRDPNTIGTPGSTTRPRSSNAANQRDRNDTWSKIPTTHEMEEFFACAEQQQQNAFIQKYNFDIMNDVPLPGRYDWQVIP